MSLSARNQFNFNPTEAEAPDEEGVETSLSLPQRITSDDIELDASEATPNPNDETVTSYKRYGIVAGSAILLTLLVAVAASSSVAAKNKSVVGARVNSLGKSGKGSPFPKSGKGSPFPKSGKGSCVSGDAGLFKVNDDDSVTVITLKEAEPGDKVKGLDADKNNAVCEVQALGYWGEGALYGNYTASHYVYDESSGDIVEHGEVGEYSVDDLFILLSTCPLVLDETEQAFTPIDSDVNLFPAQGGNIIEWSNYVNIFNALLGFVSIVGICVMDQEGYADFLGWKEFSVVLNEGNKKCADNGGEDCIVAVNLIEEAAQFYSEPCKSSYIAAIQQWLVLRDAEDTATLQQLIAVQTGQRAP